ncbi:hypothetical protein TRFO_17720 [Tritrichomonas foetus]|uniref:Uncharacterized protein n=1 Tax=Tritrichomonas foetus TaxID=1144522 RepID=A0A1J4KSJ5_9EUKA|nr:hypothetical protein TRFO_17720 [Tritrichomonas foetus]|eukprot:OHT12445.1 hypothetical protein TRFO_17720 [Tritrichomonas foetus]
MSEVENETNTSTPKAETEQAAAEPAKEETKTEENPTNAENQDSQPEAKKDEAPDNSATGEAKEGDGKSEEKPDSTEESRQKMDEMCTSQEKPFQEGLQEYDDKVGKPLVQKSIEFANKFRAYFGLT